MELSRIISGQVQTEKAERQKVAGRTYTLQVHPDATKIDVARALETYFGVNVESVRVHRLRPKARLLGNDKTLTKRHRAKRALVTLTKKSKALDLTSFKVS